MVVTDDQNRCKLKWEKKTMTERRQMDFTCYHLMQTALTLLYSVRT